MNRKSLLLFLITISNLLTSHLEASRFIHLDESGLKAALTCISNMEWSKAIKERPVAMEEDSERVKAIHDCLTAFTKECCARVNGGIEQRKGAEILDMSKGAEILDMRKRLEILDMRKKKEILDSICRALDSLDCIDKIRLVGEYPSLFFFPYGGIGGVDFYMMKMVRFEPDKAGHILKFLSECDVFKGQINTIRDIMLELKKDQIEAIGEYINLFKMIGGDNLRGRAIEFCKKLNKAEIMYRLNAIYSAKETFLPEDCKRLRGEIIINLLELTGEEINKIAPEVKTNGDQRLLQRIIDLKIDCINLRSSGR